MLHRGYEAWIADADKERFVEYDTRVDGGDATGRTITCFIPSESGKVNVPAFAGAKHAMTLC